MTQGNSCWPKLISLLLLLFIKLDKIFLGMLYVICVVIDCTVIKCVIVHTTCIGLQVFCILACVCYCVLFKYLFIIAVLNYFKWYELCEWYLQIELFYDYQAFNIYVVPLQQKHCIITNFLYSIISFKQNYKILFVLNSSW
jgi:hypothetical protein